MYFIHIITSGNKKHSGLYSRPLVRPSPCPPLTQQTKLRAQKGEDATYTPVTDENIVISLCFSNSKFFIPCSIASLPRRQTFLWLAVTHSSTSLRRSAWRAKRMSAWEAIRSLNFRFACFQSSQRSLIAGFRDCRRYRNQPLLSGQKV